MGRRIEVVAGLSPVKLQTRTIVNAREPPIVPSAGHVSASPSAAARTAACIPPPTALASQAARRRRPDPAPESQSRPRQGAAALVAKGASPAMAGSRDGPF